MADQPIEIERARELVLERVAPLAGEQVAVGAALGRVLAEDVDQRRGRPGLRQLGDGRLRGAGGGHDRGRLGGPGPPGAWSVSRAPATRPQRPLASGEAIAISTGAMVPEGADAVVRVEDTTSTDGSVEVAVEVEAGRDIRRAGEDIGVGETVLRAGTEVGPAAAGVLTSIGRERVSCALRPRVRVLTTGDELHEPGEPLPPGSDPQLERLLDRGAAAAQRRGAARGRDRPRRSRRHSRRARSERSRATWWWSAAASRSASTTTCARRSPSSASSRSSGASPCGRARPRTSASDRPCPATTGCEAEGLGGPCASACPATRSRRWSPSCSSCGRRSGRCSGRPIERPRTTATLDSELPSASRAHPARPLPARARRRRLARAPDQRRPGLARAHLDARRGRARDRAGGRAPPSRRRHGSRSSSCPEPAAVRLPAMEVEVRLFAILRERAGRERLALELPEGGDGRRCARRRGPRARARRAAPGAAGARRGQPRVRRRGRADRGRRRARADPAGERWCEAPPAARVTEEPLSIVGLANSVGRPGAGAVVVFCGVTREVERLEYEAYAEMATERIERILAEAVAEHRARGRGGRAPGRIGAAGRAERGRRGLGRAPRRGLRRRPGGDRPDQGRGADLEARGGRRRRDLGARARPRAGADARRGGAAHSPRSHRQRPDGRRRRQGRDPAARARRGAAADVARDGRGARPRRRAQGRRPRDRPDRRDRRRQAHRRADPARAPAGARLRRRRGRRSTPRPGW